MNFLEILHTYNVPYKREGEHRHARSGWVQLNCPWCDVGSGRFHLGYNLSKGYSSCWSCGYHRLGDLVKQLTGEQWSKVKHLIQDIQLEHVTNRTSGKLEIPKGIGPLKRAHKQYLTDERGLDPDTVQRVWGVQGIAIHPKLGWRLWIPVHLNGEVVSWTTRAIGDDPQRYLSAKPEQESVSHKTILYGADHARHAIIICEGPIDCWAIGPGAVATLGTGFTRPQASQASKFLRRIVCFDNDPKAQQRAQQLANDLAAFPGETINVQLDAKDAAEASKSEIKQLRKLLE